MVVISFSGNNITQIYIFNLGYNRYTSKIILMIVANFTRIFVKLATFMKFGQLLGH
jgi:hypothetical protein